MAKELKEWRLDCRVVHLGIRQSSKLLRQPRLRLFNDCELTLLALPNKPIPVMTQMPMGNGMQRHG